MMMKMTNLYQIRCYLWDDVPNWGDQLGFDLLKHFLSRHSDVVEHDLLIVPTNKIKEANIIGLGSTLGHVPHDWSGVIAGSGFLKDSNELQCYPYANIVGVRGYCSNYRVATWQDPNRVYGDPGLITPHLLNNCYSPYYDIGIIPHWSDTALKYDSRFYGPWTTKLINPFQSWRQVVADITNCKKIVTSSLHGTVIADAYGIPRRIVPAWSMIHNPSEGGMFKFKDYMSVLEMEYKPEILERADQNRIEKIQGDILSMYITLPHILDEHFKKDITIPDASV